MNEHIFQFFSWDSIQTANLLWIDALKYKCIGNQLISNFCSDVLITITRSLTWAFRTLFIWSKILYQSYFIGILGCKIFPRKWGNFFLRCRYRGPPSKWGWKHKAGAFFWREKENWHDHRIQLEKWARKHKAEAFFLKSKRKLTRPSSYAWKIGLKI